MSHLAPHLTIAYLTFAYLTFAYLTIAYLTLRYISQSHISRSHISPSATSHGDIARLATSHHVNPDPNLATRLCRQHAQ